MKLVARKFWPNCNQNMANKKTKETVYRSPDGGRYRLTRVAKYGNELMAVRIKDGHIVWDTSNLNELIEESIWLKANKNEKTDKK